LRQALHGFLTVFEMTSSKARATPTPTPNPTPTLTLTLTLALTLTKARVGLLPKRREEGEEGEEGAERRRRRRDGCAARPQCVGQQHYTAATNTCEQPQCAARYLRSYDAASGTCLLSPSFEALALVLLVAFALAELTLQEWHTRLPHSSAQEEEEEGHDGPGGREGEAALPDSALRRRHPWGVGLDA
jgi:hypothetical protein